VDAEGVRRLREAAVAASEDAVHEFEKRFISRVLGCCDGSLTKAAVTLGIHRNTLTRKMGEYKLKRHTS